MSKKTRCACCSTNFLGRVTTCSVCRLPCCATCKNNGSIYGTCCKCSNEGCFRTNPHSNYVSNNSQSVEEISSQVADISLQEGFVHPITRFGTRYADVGPNGPDLSEFQSDDRWNWPPYQNFVKHVYKHVEFRKQISGDDYKKCASWSTDYGVDNPTWNGTQYDRSIEYDEVKFMLKTHPSYYEPEPIEAFEPKFNVEKPKTMDPPDVLLEIKSACSNDTSNYFCYNHFWTPGPLEDPSR